MEFARYYDATELMEKMIKDGELLSYKDSGYVGLYVCMDTNDFWVCRILKNMNDKYEREDGVYLLERNKIDEYEYIRYYRNNKKLEKKQYDRYSRDKFLERLDILDIIKTLILMDDEAGLEGWDLLQTNSVAEAVEVIDGGFGIVELEI